MMPDPILAAKVRRWLGGHPARVGAERLGMPKRTLEAIIQGRGFRYPRLLELAMQAVALNRKQGE